MGIGYSSHIVLVITVNDSNFYMPVITDEETFLIQKMTEAQVPQNALLRFYICSAILYFALVAP